MPAWNGLTDALEWTHCLFLTLPPSACVSSSDPTLTAKNVTEVMGKVEDWVRVARGDGIFTSGLGFPDSKLLEIKQQSSSERDKSRSLGRYWVNTDPDASWVRLGRVLYKVGEETAAVMVKQYLPKGMLVSWNWTSVLWCLHSKGCTPMLNGSLV